MRGKLAWIIALVLTIGGFVLLVMSFPGDRAGLLSRQIQNASSGLTSEQTIKKARSARKNLQDQTNRRKNNIANQKTILEAHASGDADFHFPPTITKQNQRIQSEELSKYSPGHFLGLTDKGVPTNTPWENKGVRDGMEVLPLQDLIEKRDDWKKDDSNERKMRMALSCVDVLLDTMAEFLDTNRSTKAFQVHKFDFENFATTNPETAYGDEESDPFEHHTFKVILSLDQLSSQILIEVLALKEFSQINLSFTGFSLAPPFNSRGQLAQLEWTHYDGWGIDVSEEERKRPGGYDEWVRQRKKDRYDEERDAIAADESFTVKLPVNMCLRFDLRRPKKNHPIMKERKFIDK